MKGNATSPSLGTSTGGPVGTKFAVLNPPVDPMRATGQASDQGKSTVTIFAVGKHRYFTEGEAIRAAETRSRLTGEPAEILVGVGQVELMPFRQVTSEESAEVEPNPLAAKVRQMIEPVLDRIADTCPFVDCYGPMGIKDGGRGSERPETDEECLRVTACVAVGMETFDARNRIPEQVAGWLRRVARKLRRAAKLVSQIPDRRNLRPLRGVPIVETGERAGCIAETSETADGQPVCPFSVGESILFLYPKHPFHGVPSPLEPHYIQVNRVVDKFAEPFEPAEVEADSLRFRDRFMIHGTRIDTGAHCEFALDRMCCMVAFQELREKAA